MDFTFRRRLAEKQDELWNDARNASPSDRLVYFAARHPQTMIYLVPTLAFATGVALF